MNDLIIYSFLILPKEYLTDELDFEGMLTHLKSKRGYMGQKWTFEGIILCFQTRTGRDKGLITAKQYGFNPIPIPYEGKLPKGGETDETEEEGRTDRVQV